MTVSSQFTGDIRVNMADNGDDDSQYRIKEGDYVVLKRGDIFKAVQIQPKKWVKKKNKQTGTYTFKLAK